MIDERILGKILTQVAKPARYIGGEVHSVHKDPPSSIRYAMCFPDVYDIAMSHMGTQILYYVINDHSDHACERVFCPWPDMEEKMRKAGLPLFSLEDKRPFNTFDAVGFTLQYELSYTNVLNMLDLGRIPLLSKDRGEDDPIVFAGGPCAYNPEPLADFVDVFSLGEGEESLIEYLDLIEEGKKAGWSRKTLLRKMADLPGAYVPAFYEVAYREDGTIAQRTALEGVPEMVQKRIMEDFDASFHLTRQIVPTIGTVHDRAVTEIFRGCTQGCRFCQAGMVYRPIRNRSVENIAESTAAVLKATGYGEVSLSSLSTCDYPELRKLVDILMEDHEEDHVAISLPSLRLDSESLDVLKKVERVKKTGLTFAPEAGSQRLRDVINKNISREDIDRAVGYAFSEGYSGVKFYFMIGLPTEMDEDLEGIPAIGNRVKHMFFNRPKEEQKGNLRITLSASCFVPKPFTPFQWEGQTPRQELARKAQYIKDRVRDPKIGFQYHDPETSYLEGVFARGDRRLGKVLLKAHQKGCKYDGWADFFDFDAWMGAFEETGVNPDFYALRQRDFSEILPWDFIDLGVTKGFLWLERTRALKGQTTPDCRFHCHKCGVQKELAGVYCR